MFVSCGRDTGKVNGKGAGGEREEASPPKRGIVQEIPHFKINIIK